MQHTNKFAGLALAVAMALSAPGLAAASDADDVREAKDRAEIAELMWRYSRALDTTNEDAYAAVFTPDGAFGETKGTEALRKMIVDIEKGQTDRAAKGQPSGAMFHIDTNQHIEFVTKDHARVYYYWMTAFAAPKRGDPVRVAAVGHGVDDIVRVNGKWLIKMRNVAPPN